MKALLEKLNLVKLYVVAIGLHFALFSFNALASSTMAALIGAEWEQLATQKKFLILVAIAANWTGLVLVYVQKGMSRISRGKSPVETGDTDHLTK